MFKRSIKLLAIIFATSMLLTSCYSYTTVVGNGGQGGEETTSWNHYLIYGLVPVGVSNPSNMNDGASNYTVHTRQTFLNGILHAITAGIYSPTTTTVTK